MRNALPLLASNELFDRTTALRRSLSPAGQFRVSAFKFAIVPATSKRLAAKFRWRDSKHRSPYRVIYEPPPPPLASNDLFGSVI